MVSAGPYGRAVLVVGVVIDEVVVVVVVVVVVMLVVVVVVVVAPYTRVYGKCCFASPRIDRRM